MQSPVRSNGRSETSMKVHAVEQGSEEWLRLRAGIPTASEFRHLVTPTWKRRTGQGVESYLARKLAERWRKAPLAGWSGGAMEQGSLREDEAVAYFEIMTEQKVQRVGFVTTDDGAWGCSPDGLLDDRTGVEIKCPEPHTHIRYLLEGKIPDDYQAQVQGAMLVTGASTWRFVSFCRSFPVLLVSVKRDEAAMTALSEALTAFCQRLDAGYARLVELGGEPEEDEYLPF